MIALVVLASCALLVVAYLAGKAAGIRAQRAKLLELWAQREAAIREAATLRVRVRDLEEWAAGQQQQRDPADHWKPEGWTLD